MLSRFSKTSRKIFCIQTSSQVSRIFKYSTQMESLTSTLAALGVDEFPSIPPGHPSATENPLNIFRSHIAERLAPIAGVEPKAIFEGLDRSTKPETGDFVLAVPRLRIKGSKPQELSAKWQSEFKESPLVAKVVSAGAFMQFFISNKAVTSVILPQILQRADKYGQNTIDDGKKAIIEFSSPNIAKPFHAGHLRSTIIGSFLANIHEACGWNVTRMNYLGDWGKQFGLLAVGFEMFGKEELLEKDPIQHLYEVYVKINTVVYDEKIEDAKKHGIEWPPPGKDKKAKTEAGAEEVDPEEFDATEATPAVAKNGEEKYTPESPSENKAREFFQRMENGDKSAVAVWERFRNFSIDRYIETYQRLNIKYDVYSGESQVRPESIQKANEILLEKGLLVEDKGAQLVNLEKYKLAKPLIKKRDGTSLYLTRDIGAAKQRFDEYNFDKMVYVVASQQDLHLKQLFKVLELMGYEWANKCSHVNFGMVLGMSTRKGNVVKLDDMLDTAKDSMHEIMRKNETKYAQVQDPESTADIVGKAAIMVQDMSAKRVHNYQFSWERMLSAEGDTGVYLQYAHARFASIGRKSDLTPADAKNADLSLLTEPHAFTVLRSLAEYPEVILMALKTSEPSTIVTYLFKITHLASTAYETLIVKGAEPEVAKARYAVYLAVQTVLANGMRLLGLTPLERM